jgi:ketosteroid isomerase-like protein
MYMINTFLRKCAAVRLASLVLVCVFGCSAAGVCADEGQDRESDRRAIHGVLIAQQEAWSRGDVDAFMAGYWRSPELTFSGSNGISRGWDGVLARYKKNYPDRAAMGQLDFSDLEFRFLGADHALVLGRWHLKRAKDELGGVFSLVWQRSPEGWRIIHDHTSAKDAAK